MKFGQLIRKAIQEDKFEAVMNDEQDGLRKTLFLSEAETQNPWDHHDTLRSKYERAKQVSIPDLFESLIGPIRSNCYGQADWQRVTDLLEAAETKTRLNMPLEEAEVHASAFQRLTQAKLFTTSMANYELTPAVFESLFGSFPSPYRTYDHHIPSDAPELVYTPQGEAYPERQIADRYCVTKAFKFGARVSLTRETLIQDRTGMVVQTIEGMAQSAKYREDELAAKAFQDLTNFGTNLVRDEAEADAGCYHPRGTQVALYRTSAGSTETDYESAINLTGTNNLRQWDSLQVAMKLMRSMTNLAGQKIDVIGAGAIKLVVPEALEERARMLTAPGALIQVDQNASAGTESSFHRVPDAIRQHFGVQSVEVIVWRKLAEASTANQSDWYVAGDSQKQFKRHVRWEVEFNRANQSQLGGDDFKRDIMMSFRAGFNAGFRAVDDKYVIKSPGG